LIIDNWLIHREVYVRRASRSGNMARYAHFRRFLSTL
jgi:hypothetical protein